MKTAICVAKTTKTGVIIYNNRTTVRTHNIVSEEYSHRKTGGIRSKQNTKDFVRELLQTPEVRLLAQIYKIGL